MKFLIISYFLKIVKKRKTWRKSKARGASNPLPFRQLCLHKGLPKQRRECFCNTPIRMFTKIKTNRCRYTSVKSPLSRSLHTVPDRIQRKRRGGIWIVAAGTTLAEHSYLVNQSALFVTEPHINPGLAI